MELHYIYENNRNIIKIIKFFLVMMILLPIMFIFLDLFFNKRIIWENVRFCITLGIGISLISGVICSIMQYIVNKLIIKYHKIIIKNGEKAQAIVFATKFRTPVRQSIASIYSLLLKINQDIYSLEYLENNKAFKDLTKYFEMQNSFNHKNNQKLTIDVYLYKNKIYGDLKSINLKIIHNKIRNEA